MRKPPNVSPPPLTPKHSGLITKSLEYKVITPLFGGGVEAQTADPVTVVRAQTVVGQLRFWWRACRAASFASPTAMREREMQIWGSTSLPSKVDVDVRVLQRGEEKAPFEIVSRPDGKPSLRAIEAVAPAYAAFPLQPAQSAMRVGMNLKKLRIGVSFSLTLSYPAEMANEIDAAIWAWETFGGIGARTRRGFGSLRRLKLDGAEVVPPKTVDALRQEILAGLGAHVSEPQHPTLCPHLPQTIAPQTVPYRLRSGSNVVECWRSAIKTYRDFRQQRTPPAPGTKHEGRSYWPEPDVVRRLTGQHASRHAPLTNFDFAPRSLFGLPIILHFKDLGDPRDATIQGINGEDRMASRLILKTFELSTGAAAMAFVLRGPRLPVDRQNRDRHVQIRTQNGTHTIEATTNRSFTSLGSNRDPLGTAQDNRTDYTLEQTFNAFLRKFESR